MRFGLTLAIVSLFTHPALAQETFRSRVVVCQEANAAEAGAGAMRAGGNAVDAAVATAFALAVTHPAAGNIGGGGFIVAHLAGPKRVVTVDFREMAPKAATERMYLGEDGKPRPGHRAGALAAGVPGTVRGLGLAHAEWGRLPWADLVRPAEKLAREGFPITATLARSLNAQIFPRDPADGPGVNEDLGSQPDRLGDFPASVAAFRRPDGKRWSEGDRLIQTDLADTLGRIAATGPDEFYTGQTAAKIADFMASNGGLVTRDDLAAYKAAIRPAVHGTFRGHEVYGMGPPGSGGIVILEALNILERYDLKADGPRSPRTDPSRDRGHATRLLSRERLAHRRPGFRPTCPTKKLDLEGLRRRARLGPSPTAPPSSASARPVPRSSTARGRDTTHLSTLDSTRGTRSRSPTRWRRATAPRPSSLGAWGSCSTTRWATST